MKKTTIRNLAGSGPLGFGLCLVIFCLCRLVERKLQFPPLVGGKGLHLTVAVSLMVLATLIFYAALRALPPSKHNKILVTDGPYAYVRHPRYSAMVFCVYPAAALFMHSTLCLISTILAYLAFKLAATIEERKLIQILGQDYQQYMERTPAFIPGTRRRKSAAR